MPNIGDFFCLITKMTRLIKEDELFDNFIIEFIFFIFYKLFE